MLFWQMPLFCKNNSSDGKHYLQNLKEFKKASILEKTVVRTEKQFFTKGSKNQLWEPTSNSFWFVLGNIGARTSLEVIWGLLVSWKPGAERSWSPVGSRNCESSQIQELLYPVLRNASWVGWRGVKWLGVGWGAGWVAVGWDGLSRGGLACLFPRAAQNP